MYHNAAAVQQSLLAWHLTYRFGIGLSALKQYDQQDLM